MESHTLVRHVIWKKVQTNGLSACTCPTRFAAFLRQWQLSHLAVCQPLLESVRCEIPSELMRLSTTPTLLRLLLPQIINRLEQKLADLRKEQINWIVETWAMIVGLTPYQEAPYPSNESVSTTGTTPPPGHAIQVSTVAFDTAGNRLVTAGWDQSVRVWDGHTHQQIQCFGDPITQSDLMTDEGGVSILMFRCAEFSTVGDRVIAGAQDGALYSWCLSDGAEDRIERAHNSPVLALAMHPHGQQFASAGRDGLVVMWNMPDIRRLRRFDLSQAVHRVRFSPDGRLLAAACDDGSVRIICLEMNQEWTHLKTDDCAYRSLAFSPNGHHLATAGMGNAVALWDTRTWTIAQRFHLHSEADDIWAPCVAFDRAGTRLAAGGSDGVARIWNSATTAFVEKYRPKPARYGRSSSIPCGMNLSLADPVGASPGML